MAVQAHVQATLETHLEPLAVLVEVVADILVVQLPAAQAQRDRDLLVVQMVIKVAHLIQQAEEEVQARQRPMCQHLQ